MAAELDRNARCQPLPTPTPTEVAALLVWYREQLTLPGLTPAYLNALATCVAEPSPCFGLSQACLAVRAERKGTLAMGSACQDDGQCASGACSGNAETCGTCVASVGLNQSCESAEDASRCAAGLGCNGLVCKPNVWVGENESCEGGNQFCQSELHCASTTSGRVCLLTAAPGASCRSAAGSLRCAQGSTRYCDASTELCELRPAVGASCAEMNCAGGLVCDVNGSEICRAPRTNVAVDAECWTGDACVTGASCEREDPGTGIRHCTVGAPAGAPCGAAVGGCAAGLVCDDDSHKCVPRSPVCP